jgi:hypothetical protein
VIEAPVEVPGWECRPWVRLRALTEAEALERESLGLAEEYELVTGGLQEPAVRVRRTYDLRLMAEYDHEHCVVEACVPEVQSDGTIVERRIGRGAETNGVLTPTPLPRPSASGEGNDNGNGAAAEVLGRMQPALAEWLHREIERVNRRLPEQRAVIETAKKG